jgi:hypothetical protein
MVFKLLFSFIPIIILLACAFATSVNAASIMWNKTYGVGLEAEMGYSVIETSDGGYAIAGGGMAAGSSYNFWLVKTDRYGNEQWNQAYIGGIGAEWAKSVVQVSDGGYVLAGGGFFVGKNFDFWLVKTDEYGNMEWNRTYGGIEWDEAHSLVKTYDGGFALAGQTESYGYGNADFWLIKTDADGIMEWNRTYGGPNYDVAESLIATSDSGYCLVGSTKSFGEGNADCWLLKTDSQGDVQWNQTYGGAGDDWAYSLIQTSDGGYAIAGGTESFGVEVDFWLIKTNWLGNIEWNQTYAGPEPYGESQFEHARSLVESSDGGYVLAGITRSENIVAHPFDTDDVWMVKTDGLGSLEWNQTYGGYGDQGAYSLITTSDGGYAIAGYSLVGENMNFLLIKTNEYGIIPEFPSWTILPLVLVTTLIANGIKRKCF